MDQYVVNTLSRLFVLKCCNFSTLYELIYLWDEIHSILNFFFKLLLQILAVGFAKWIATFPSMHRHGFVYYCFGFGLVSLHAIIENVSVR